MQQVIDLRSDVVTRSPPSMLEAMRKAPILNNELQEDIEAISFQQRLATLFGH